MSIARPKILIVSNNYPPFYDGISVLTSTLYNQLKKRGYIVEHINFDKEYSKQKLKLRDIFYTKATQNSYYSLFSLLNPVNFSHPDKGLKNFIFTNMVYRVVRDKMEEFKPDIVHITYPRLYSAALAIDRPIIFFAYSEEIKNRIPVQIILEMADSIVSISKFTTKLIKKISMLAAEKTSIIPCSIEVKNYIPDSQNKKEDIILAIGRLSREKNFDTTIKAFSLLPDNYRKKFQYIIIGNGEEYDNLTTLIKELDLEHSVHIKKNIDDKEKIVWLKKSKYFLLCPRIKKDEQEGFGIVFLEAQAAGLVVIASKVGGIQEAAGGGAIYIEHPENPTEITNALIKVLENPTVSNKLITFSKNRIEQFDHSKWIEKIEEIYTKLRSNK